METITDLERNKDTARSFFFALDRLDRAALGEIYHDNFLLDYPGNDQPMDRDAHWQLMNGYHTGFPDMLHRPDLLIAESDRVCVRGTILGTNTGSLLGQEPTGKTVNVQFLNVMTFRDGRLLSLFSLLDLASLQKQLGLAKVLFSKD